MRHYQADVLIAGGEPAALALAIELNHRGISCIVLDYPEQPCRTPAAPVSNPRTLDHFRRWGIACTEASIEREGLRAHSKKLRNVVIRAGLVLNDFVQDDAKVRSAVRTEGETADNTISSRYLVSASGVLTQAGYRDRRVCVLGAEVEHDNALSSHAFSEAIEDGVDLGWKLAAVLKGWGGTRLLDSYQTERRPLSDAPVGRITAASHLAQSKRASKVAEGSTAPHFLMRDGRSLYDGFGPDFTLLATGGWAFADLMLAKEEARDLGFPLTVLQAPAPALEALYGARLALIRPDRRVAWHGDAWPFEGKQLLKQVTGH